MGKDIVSATSNLSLAISDFPFCHLKNMKNNFWDYSAALSFGRTEIWDDFLEKSYVGRLHKDFGYEPVATFDLGNIGQNISSAIYIGSYNMSRNSYNVGTAQNYANDKGWSFEI